MKLTLRASRAVLSFLAYRREPCLLASFVKPARKPRRAERADARLMGLMIYSNLANLACNLTRLGKSFSLELPEMFTRPSGEADWRAEFSTSSFLAAAPKI